MPHDGMRSVVTVKGSDGDWRQEQHSPRRHA